MSTAMGRPVEMSSRTVLVGQFFLALYGGYFGGAVGILMLALWSVGLGALTLTGRLMGLAGGAEGLAPLPLTGGRRGMGAGEAAQEQQPQDAVLPADQPAAKAPQQQARQR